MAILSVKNILQDKKTKDPNSITSLVLTHKALTDVSCLREFKNLERLDLSSNNLTSLEGLKECVNLKWLSVVQNKLQNLGEIEGLSKLVVLNAGKNMLTSMDEVKPLTSLRALILNDNKIISICGLDEMKELNTLVLSRNPISAIGESLPKVKSVVKVSLSHCQIQTIGSLKSCTELKELRLAHNDIKTLPSELVHNSKLQLLDVGNNVINSLSDLKVLSSLSNLRNLNTQGNPISEKNKSMEKIRKLVPNLRIFNAKPIDKKAKIEKDDGDERINDSFVNAAENPWDVKEEKIKDNSSVVDKKLKKVQENVVNEINNHEPQLSPERNDLKRKKDNSIEVETENRGDDSVRKEKKSKKKTKRVKLDTISSIDDPDIPFTDLFGDNIQNVVKDGRVMDDKVTKDLKENSTTLISFPEKKKIKSRDKVQALQLSPGAEIGLGGSSTWGD